ncbi:MAG: SLC13 family permease [Oribacterium sp.]|nr:SLC13 family permease [Oribacterium sp.]
MSYQLIVCLIVLIIMIVGFLWHKRPYGVVAMLCVAILAVTGVIDEPTAFSGFSHNTTILVATMMVVAGAIGKTSLALKIRQRMAVIQGKNGILLVLLIIAFTALLCQIMGMTAVMSIMLLVVQTLDDDSEMSQSRMYFLCAATICAWFGRIPIGMGAALPLQQNAYYEGLVNGNSAYLLGMFDYFKVGIIPTICLSLYCLFAWKLIPKQKIDIAAVSAGSSTSAQETLPKEKETVIFIVFLAVMIAFIFSKKLGALIYLIPFLGVLVLIYTKALSVREVVATLSSDMVFMVAGVLVISSALSSSGAGEFVGRLILAILGDHPSSLLVISVFAIATTIMTTFLSNTGTVAIMTPLAVSTAIAGGMNPKAVVLVIFASSCLAIAFPTGCSAATMAYAVGKFNPIKMLRFTIPFLLIGLTSLIISAEIFYPVYN